MVQGFILEVASKILWMNVESSLDQVDPRWEALWAHLQTNILIFGGRCISQRDWKGQFGEVELFELGVGWIDFIESAR